MTDVLTPSARGISKERADGGNKSTRNRALAAAVLVGALVGGALFAGTRGGPTPAEIAQIRAEQTVGYYETRYARSGSAAIGASEDAHWQAVVNYYEEQWASRQK